MSNITAILLFELTAITTASDGILSFTILFEERPIVRDRAKILDIERAISNTTYHLGKTSKIAQKIANTDKINQILKVYQEKKLLTENSNFGEEISYPDLLAELTQLNIQLKVFLAYNTTSQMESKNGTYLYFHPERIAQIKQDYECARFTLGFSCSQAGQNFKGQINNMWSTTKSS